MTTVNQNFNIYAGNTKKIIVTVKDDNDVALNLTNSSIKWGYSDVLKTTSSGIAITNAAGGEFTITLNPTDTQNKNGTFTHSCELTDAIGNVTTILIGSIIIKKGM